jgi:hypothetical protein
MALQSFGSPDLKGTSSLRKRKEKKRKQKKKKKNLQFLHQSRLSHYNLLRDLHISFLLGSIKL